MNLVPADRSCTCAPHLECEGVLLTAHTSVKDNLRVIGGLLHQNVFVLEDILRLPHTEAAL